MAIIVLTVDVVYILNVSYHSLAHIAMLEVELINLLYKLLVSLCEMLFVQFINKQNK